MPHKKANKFEFVFIGRGSPLPVCVPANLAALPSFRVIAGRDAFGFWGEREVEERRGTEDTG